MKSTNLIELLENVTDAKSRLSNLGVFNSVFATIDVANNQKKGDYKVSFKFGWINICWNRYFVF